MTIENLGKFLENYKKLNSSKKIEDNSLLDENCDVNFKKAAKWNNGVLASDRDADPNFVVTGKYIVSKLDDSKDSVLQLDEFKDYFTQKGFFGKEYISDSQLEELYDLISAIDGTEGVSADDLDYLIGLGETKDGITESAIKNFLSTIREFSKAQGTSSSDSKADSSDSSKAADTTDSSKATGSSSSSSSDKASDTEADTETEAEKKARERKEAQEAQKKEEEAAKKAKEEARQKAIAQRKEKFDGKTAQNFETLNPDTSLEDMSIIKDSVNFSRGLTAMTTLSQKLDGYGDNEKDGEVTAKEIIDAYGTDGKLSLEQFNKVYRNGKNLKDQVLNELYSLISSIDGEEGITEEELQYVMDFSDDSTLTSEDVKLFIAEVKKQLEKTASKISENADSSKKAENKDSSEASSDTYSASEASLDSNNNVDESGALEEENAQTSAADSKATEAGTSDKDISDAFVEAITRQNSDSEIEYNAKFETIKSGDTPIGFMKKVSGANGFNKDDYAALIEMNIKMGYISQDDVKMTDAQKEKYGVEYMLHPDMNLKIYSQSQIEEFKKTGKVLETSSQKLNTQDYEGDNNISTRVIKDSNNKAQAVAFYSSDSTIAINESGILTKYSENSTEKYDLRINYDDGGHYVDFEVALLSNFNDDIPESSALYKAISSFESGSDYPIAKVNDYYCFQGVLYDKEGSKVELESLTLMEAS